MVRQILNLYDAVVGHLVPVSKQVDNLQGRATQELLRQS